MQSAPPPLKYDAYTFKQIAYVTQENGKISKVQGKDVETILIAKDWQLCEKSDHPHGGYISSRFLKYAFEVRPFFLFLDYLCVHSSSVYRVSRVWLLMPFCNTSTFSQVSNEANLSNELALLILGQYFIDSFYKQAKVFTVKGLPHFFSFLFLHVLQCWLVYTGMSWNVDGTFVGKLDTNVLPPPDELDDDDQSLVFTAFLAVPLLPSGPSYKEQKFSGNTEVGQNSSSIGQAVDVYAHHGLVDSQQTVLLGDLQGNIHFLAPVP
jgi:hypothetical protein